MGDPNTPGETIMLHTKNDGETNNLFTELSSAEAADINGGFGLPKWAKKAAKLGGGVLAGAAIGAFIGGSGGSGPGAIIGGIFGGAVGYETVCDPGDFLCTNEI
jgi:hypothetical protein